MKFLNDKDYNALKVKADHFNTIVNAIVENGEGITAEDVTAETVIQAMQQEAPESDTSDLQTRIEKISEDNTDLKTQLETANARVAELEKELNETPAEQPATITSKGEAGEKQDILDFAKKHADNPFAVLAEAEKQGYL